MNGKVKKVTRRYCLWEIAAGRYNFAMQ